MNDKSRTEGRQEGQVAVQCYANVKLLFHKSTKVRDTMQICSCSLHMTCAAVHQKESRVCKGSAALTSPEYNAYACSSALTVTVFLLSVTCKIPKYL